MNREIKFRVWDKVNNKFWILSQEEILCNDRDYCCYNHIDYKNGCLQQFTGLKDKNNKEIYEDDIIKCSEIDSSSPTTGKRTVLQSFIAVVTWNKTLLGYYYNPISGTGYNNPHQGLCYAYNIEVIGNIFETPELLKNE